MRIHQIDNGAKDLGKVVTWQYDHAYCLLLMIQYMQDLYDAAVKSFWTGWREKVLDITNCSDFGAALWGMFLGVSRPRVRYSLNPDTPVALDLPSFRRLLRGAFFLLNSSGSMSDIAEYLQILFTPDGFTEDHCAIRVVDNLDMSISFEKVSEEKYNALSEGQRILFEQCGDLVLPYPLGIKENRPVAEAVFGFQGQQSKKLWNPIYAYQPGEVIQHCDENNVYRNYEVLVHIDATPGRPKAWSDVASKVRPTFRGDPYVQGLSADGDEGRQIGFPVIWAPYKVPAGSNSFRLSFVDDEDRIYACHTPVGDRYYVGWTGSGVLVNSIYGEDTYNKVMELMEQWCKISGGDCYPIDYTHGFIPNLRWYGHACAHNGCSYLMKNEESKNIRFQSWDEAKPYFSILNRSTFISDTTLNAIGQIGE